MLQAAYETFCASGYAATTMEAIAERAEVAVQTLYFTFRNKAAILNEVLHAAVVGFEQWSPSLDTEVRTDHLSTARASFPWYPRFEAERDPRQALRIYVDGTAEILARVGPLMAAVSARGVPELEATLASSEALREEASGFLVAALKAKGKGLRTDLTLQRAVDIFMVLTSAQLFHQFTAGRGWSLAETKRWWVELLAQQLLAA
jgi:AcrR family transcriptional regulator